MADPSKDSKPTTRHDRGGDANYCSDHQTGQDFGQNRPIFQRHSPSLAEIRRSRQAQRGGESVPTGADNVRRKHDILMDALMDYSNFLSFNSHSTTQVVEQPSVIICVHG